MRRHRGELHTLAGAYVLDAVPDSERAAFERHLAGCAACQAEVREMREATARLAGAAAVRPRPALRDATLAAAARVRQLPPPIGQQHNARSAGPVAHWRSRLRVPLPGRVRSPRMGWLARIGVVTATAAAIAALLLGLRLSSTQSQLSAAEQRDHAIAAVLSAADARTMTAKASTGGTATVVMSHRHRELVFIGDGLLTLPPSEAYELWLMGPAGDRPAGMLPASHRGMAGPMVVGGLRHGDRLGLTVEPASGSRRPTSSPIVMMGLGI